MSRLSQIYFLTIFVCNFLQAQDRDYIRTEIEKIIRFDSEINYKQVPGFIIGIIEQDSVYIHSFGHSSFEKKSRPLQSTDIFETGSVTKLFTARIIRKLESEKKLSVDDPLNYYLPEEFRNPRLDHLTLKNLINHQSGLPLRPTMFGAKERDSQNPYAYYTVQDLLEFYRDYIPEKENFSYSHVNYALLEIVIQEVTNLDFDDAFQKYISLPLDMTRTFVDFTEQKENFISPGFDKSGKKVSPWTFASFRASEGVKTSMNDMLIFLNRMILDNPQDSLFKKTVEEQTEYTEKSFNKNLSVQDGWHIVQIKDKTVGIHTGRTSGHNCFVGIVKDTRTAVVILSNSWFGTGDLGMQVLRMINQNWKQKL